MVVAIQFGLSTALACGAVAYVAAILLTLNWGPAAADLAAHV